MGSVAEKTCSGAERARQEKARRANKESQEGLEHEEDAGIAEGGGVTVEAVSRRCDEYNDGLSTSITLLGV